MRPPLALLYQTGVPAAPFCEFADSLRANSINVHLEERPPLGPLAGVVWTMLTGAAVFIASSYFGGILKEIGKDHYELLKRALAKVTQKTMETERIEPVLIGTGGKLSQTDPFSMAFSVWAETPGGRTIKLLIPKKTGEVDYTAVTNAFLDFIARCYDEGEGVLAETGFDITRRGGSPVTVAYNPETGKIEWANPFANR